MPPGATRSRRSIRATRTTLPPTLDPIHVTVNKAALTVTADDKSKVAGQANPAFTASYSGFVLGQDASVLGGSLVFNTTATTASPAGSYSITPSGMTSSNYQIQYIPGTLTVAASRPDAHAFTDVDPAQPPVTVVSITVGTIKVGKGKRAKKETEIVVHYSGAVDAGSAQNVASYVLTQPGRDKKLRHQG